MTHDLILVLMIVEISIVLIELVAIIALMAAKAVRDSVKNARRLTAISVDTGVTQLHFQPGEEFNHEGLLVLAHYNKPPYCQVVEDFSLTAPDMQEEGVKKVVVEFQHMAAAYQIDVKKQEKVAYMLPQERRLQGITLETGVVQKEFAVGEDFNCDGLVVLGHYNEAPVAQLITDFTLTPPSMDEEGKKVVVVEFEGAVAAYSIWVKKAEAKVEHVVRVEYHPPVQEPVPEPEPKQEPIQEQEQADEDEEDDDEPNETWKDGVRFLYSRSFTSKVIQASDEAKEWYNTIKNNLLGYKKVKGRMSWKRESFKYGREIVARLAFRGRTLCIYLPLNPNEYDESKYKVENVADKAAYADTPTMYRIKNERRARYALELIAEVMQRFGGATIERADEDYSLPYQTTDELLDAGLIKLVKASLPSSDGQPKEEVTGEISDSELEKFIEDLNSVPVGGSSSGDSDQTA